MHIACWRFDTHNLKFKYKNKIFSNMNYQIKSKIPPGGKFARYFTRLWIFIHAFVFGHKMGFHFLMRHLKGHQKLDKSQKHSGQVCVMTGGTRGIGLEIVKTLLDLDFTVILGVRSIKQMTIEIENIRKNGIASGQVKILHLDLKSLGSVGKFTEQVLFLPETTNIDLLINQAGIVQKEYEVTQDNIECHFQVNYLSHFLLTNLLLPRIKETAKSKNDKSSCHIINVSCHGHFTGSLDFDDLFKKKIYVPFKCYCDSKLCQVMHAKSLQSHLKEEKIRNIQVYSCHPGEIYTEMWNAASPIFKYICESKENAVDNVLYSALDPKLSEICGGKYFENGQKTKPNREAEDKPVRKRLWELSMELTT